MSDLTHRMKNNYEDRYRFYLPRRTYILIRLDGKAFHSYTRNLNKPFDFGFIDDLSDSARVLCESIQGCQIGYCFSDEVSVLVTDFENKNTEAWFDNNLQKMCSVSASKLTFEFSLRRVYKEIQYEIDFSTLKETLFDSRVWVIPDSVEIENYFIERQQDCVRNSIHMLARSLYSHKELKNKNCNEMQELIFQKGENWDSTYPTAKRGSLIFKKDGIWIKEPCFDFLKDRNRLINLVPKHGY